jgi:hypothetical protein
MGNTLRTPVVVDSGASDRYIITNNLGGAGVTDGGAGTQGVTKNVSNNF